MGRRGHSFVAGNHTFFSTSSLPLPFFFLSSSSTSPQPQIRSVFTCPNTNFEFFSILLLYSYFHLSRRQRQELYQRFSPRLCLRRLVLLWPPSISSTISLRSWHYAKVRKLLAIGLVTPRNVSIYLLSLAHVA